MRDRRGSGRSRGCAVLFAFVLALLGAPGARATVPYVRKLPPLRTPWTLSVPLGSPLAQYPRPQLRRPQWLSLNGLWQYELDREDESPPFGRDLAQTILVPYPVQSPLSGIERSDRRGWYRRLFTVPQSWRNRHVLLNFGAVSWSARVYVNGRLAGTHAGDYDGFSLDITRLLHPGSNELLVGYYDPAGGAGEPVGKQVPGPAGGIYHTASAGIWQTVWLEPVARTHLNGLELTPDLPRRRLLVAATTSGDRAARIEAEALAGTRVIARGRGNAGRTLVLRIAHPSLWSPWRPYLYGLRIQVYAHGRVVDRGSSYFGMRSITLGRRGGATRILLNGRFVFESGALDQGYWPDGLYTPPSDAAMRFDVAAAKRLGYDMLREHVKVQPDRWYYWADRLGLLVWQDIPNMPVAPRIPPSAAAKQEFRRELSAIVTQRRSHPSIVTWVPFNEGWDQFDPASVTGQVRGLDRAALVDSDSGAANCCEAIEPPNSDILDAHLYFGPFAVTPDRRASAIGEFGGVLPYPPPDHRWPGILTSIGSPALAWPLAPVSRFLRQQYAELEQEVQTRGLSASVFTEFACYEQELGIVTYDRRAFTIPPELLARLNGSLIAESRRLSGSPGRVATPSGASGYWGFDEGRGGRAGDASRRRHPLWLRRGAGWTRGIRGSALALRTPGADAVARAAVVDTSRSFTVSAWLSSRRSGQSASAISEPGPDGSAFSLGIKTAARGPQSLSGEVGRRRVLALGAATWWTFTVPAAPRCSPMQCGVQANMRYDDGRSAPRSGSWHLVTGVYDKRTETIVLYVDGAPEDVEHVRRIPLPRGPLTVGTASRVYGPADSFTGAVDELRTYDRALSPREVWQLYEAARYHRTFV